MNADWYAIKHFKPEEFACPCCGKNEMDLGFVKKLDKAREIAGTPFKITSGYRCSKHNKEIGGVPTSSHLIGLAADIAIPGSIYRYSILTALQNAGLVRFGIGNNFIHVDSDKSKIQNVMWTYYNKKG